MFLLVGKPNVNSIDHVGAVFLCPDSAVKKLLKKDIWARKFLA